MILILLHALHLQVTVIFLQENTQGESCALEAYLLKLLALEDFKKKIVLFVTCDCLGFEIKKKLD